MDMLQSGVASASGSSSCSTPRSRTPTPRALTNHRPVKGPSSLEHVSLPLRREDKPLIAELRLVVAPGETVAIVGSTGAGKTTMVQPADALLRGRAGRIVLDGMDTR